MIRGFLLILLLVAATAVLGVTLCRGRQIPARPVLYAAGIGLLAGEVGILPVSVYRGTDPATRFQMAWLGSILHLVLALGLGAAVLWVWHPPTMPYVLALLSVYWVTLLGLCLVLVRALRMPVIPTISTGNLHRDTR